MLKVNDIHTYYGESYILQGLSMSINERQAVALLGRNGMGKSTTIHSIMGFITPRKGSIHFRDREILNLPAYRIPRLGIGLIPQGRRIFSSLSLQENLTMAARLNDTGGKTWTLDKVYELFPLLQQRARNKGATLSGGEQQMLTIARALMTNPLLLLMDEPSEGLAPIIVKEVAEVIVRLKKSGLSILLVEQNLNMALNIVEYAYIMSKGVIVYESTPDVLRDDEEAKTKHLGISEG
jgi:branched-chain amino acid transport system ATP-binding protein